jgi:hypothetical protein
MPRREPRSRSSAGDHALLNGIAGDPVRCSLVESHSGLQVKWNHSRDYGVAAGLGARRAKIPESSAIINMWPPSGNRMGQRPPHYCRRSVTPRVRISSGTQVLRSCSSDSRRTGDVPAGLAQPPSAEIRGLQACNRGGWPGTGVLHGTRQRHAMAVTARSLAGCQQAHRIGALRWTWAAYRGALNCRGFRRLATGDAVSSLGDGLGVRRSCLARYRAGQPDAAALRAALAIAAYSLPGALARVLAWRRWLDRSPRTLIAATPRCG